MPLRIIPYHMEKYVDLDPYHLNCGSVCSNCRNTHLMNHIFAYDETKQQTTICSICVGNFSDHGLFYSVPLNEIRNLKIELIDGI